MTDAEHAAEIGEAALRAIRERLIAAERELRDLCDGRRRWTLSIPARPDSDSDLVIGAALNDARLLLERLDSPPSEDTA